MNVTNKNSICEVCGGDASIVSVKSRLSNNMFRCCKSCAEARLEPYGGIINFLTVCYVLGDPPNDTQKRKINYILNKLHISYNKFESDVHREVDEMNQAFLYVERHPEEFREARRKVKYADYKVTR